MNRKFTSGQKTQVGKIAMDAITSLDPSFEDAQRLLTDPRLASRLKALYAELMIKGFPSDALAAEHGFTVLEDNEAVVVGLNVKNLTFKSVLPDGKSWISGDEMRKRAVVLKGNFGLADAPQLLAQQADIPVELRVKYILLPATKLRDSGGSHDIACLFWHDGQWVLDFCWLDYYFYSDDLVACSE